MVEDLCSSDTLRIDEIHQARCFMQPVNSLVHFIDCTSVPAAFDLMPVMKYIRRQHGAPAHLTERINAYLSQALRTPNICLAEALFPYGGATVHFLIRMTKGHNGQYYAVGSITWVK
jgi:hypothetical protein